MMHSGVLLHAEASSGSFRIHSNLICVILAAVQLIKDMAITVVIICIIIYRLTSYNSNY